MQDRQPKYPGRVRLKDVESGVEKLYDLTMADDPSEEGTPPTKRFLLDDLTASSFGLGSEAVVNTVLGILSKAVISKDGGIHFTTVTGETIANVGNCIVYSTTYVGTGKNGESSGNRNSLKFPYTPKLVFFWKEKESSQYASDVFGVFGIDSLVSASLFLNKRGEPADVSKGPTFSISGNELIWWGESSNEQFNEIGKKYYVAAILDANT